MNIIVLLRSSLMIAMVLAGFGFQHVAGSYGQRQTQEQLQSMAALIAQKEAQDDLLSQANLWEHHLCHDLSHDAYRLQKAKNWVQRAQNELKRLADNPDDLLAEHRFERRIGKKVEEWSREDIQVFEQEQTKKVADEQEKAAQDLENAERAVLFYEKKFEDDTKKMALAKAIASDPVKKAEVIEELIRRDRAKPTKSEYMRKNPDASPIGPLGGEKSWSCYDDRVARLSEKYTENANDLEGLQEAIKTKNPNFLSNSPASMWGGIDYTMSLDEMVRVVSDKFNQMEQKGLIISKDAFEVVKDEYYWAPLTDLTRIWGADYLKRKINESPALQARYDVPDYVIVIDNDQRMLDVELSFLSNLCPVVSQLKNGTIYFKKITGGSGVDIQSKLDLGEASGIGYTDFSSPGNIILSSENGKRYIVDLEAKSFDYGKKLPINQNLKDIVDYARRKFIYQNRGGYQHLCTVPLGDDLT